jgi:hypothetical protein
MALAPLTLRNATNHGTPLTIDESAESFPLLQAYAVISGLNVLVLGNHPKATPCPAAPLVARNIAASVPEENESNVTTANAKTSSAPLDFSEAPE